MSDDSIVKIASRAEFHNAVQTALAQAEAAKAREIVMSDPTFMDWPLNDPGIVETLSRWVDARCTFTLIAHSFDELARRQSRFVAWRQQWSHVVRCRSDPELAAEQIPSLLLVRGQIVLRLLDRVQYRGTLSGRPVDLSEAGEATDALLQRSEEAFPATTLGL
ncbi:MAG: hypothetical protein ABI745_05195 [Caldimonas sp.]